LQNNAIARGCVSLLLVSFYYIEMGMSTSESTVALTKKRCLSVFRTMVLLRRKRQIVRRTTKKDAPHQVRRGLWH
jgi:hypothetical protein